MGKTSNKKKKEMNLLTIYLFNQKNNKKKTEFSNLDRPFYSTDSKVKSTYRKPSAREMVVTSILPSSVTLLLFLHGHRRVINM